MELKMYFSGITYTGYLGLEPQLRLIGEQHHGGAIWETLTEGQTRKLVATLGHGEEPYKLDWC